MSSERYIHKILLSQAVRILNNRQVCYATEKALRVWGDAVLVANPEIANILFSTLQPEVSQDEIKKLMDDKLELLIKDGDIQILDINGNGQEKQLYMRHEVSH